MISPTGCQAVLDYHRRSKHEPGHYAPGPGFLDWANQPDPFRSFAGAPRLALPLGADRIETRFNRVRRGSLPAPAALDLAHLAVLLELSLAISAWKAAGGTSWALRCNPSSGNLHPTEGYLVCPALPGLAAGVYHYRPREHALERRAAPGTPEWNAAFSGGGVLLGLAGIHWREAWKYGVRAYRYCQQDCGHAMAAVAYAAASLGWRARWLRGWGDAQVARLLGLDREADFAGAAREAPEALLWVGPGEPAPATDALLQAAAAAQWQGAANRLSAEHADWDDIPRVEAAARRPPQPPAGAQRHPPRPSLTDPPLDLGAARLIRQRRSAVDFDGATALPAPAFFGMLDALLPRDGIAPWTVFDGPPRVHPALLVHRVEGLASGLYVLARDAAALAALRAACGPQWAWRKTGPERLPLYLLAERDLRDAARLVCCHQDIAADSAFALGFIARFAEELRGAPWRYRELFWECGALGQVLYLEAEAAGLRGTGIGCYFDDEMHRLLGLAGDAFQSLYHFTVGGPLDDPRLTTLPPYGAGGRPPARE